MKTSINGEPRELPNGLSVGTLLDLLGTPRTGVAVARNEQVVRRVDYDSLHLTEGDRIEIIKAVAGG